MNTKPLIWKEGLRSTPAKPRATNIAPEEWQSHQDIIYQEYMVKDLPLKRVLQYMKHHHDFFASERQYTSQFEKWGWTKRSSHRRRSSPNYPSQALIDMPAGDVDSQPERMSVVQEVATDEANESGLEKPSSAEATQNLEDFEGVDSSDMLDLNLEPTGEPPRYSSIFGPRLVTQGLPTINSSNENVSPPLTTPNSCEDDGGTLSLSATDDDSPSTSANGYTDLSNLVKSAIFNPPSQISVQLLTGGGRCDGTVLLNSVKPKTARTLENIFRRPQARLQTDQVSDDDLRELSRTSDFLFAAQSYEDSFTLSRITYLLIEKCIGNSRSSIHIGNSPAWLVIAINMTRSATTTKDSKLVVQVLKRIRSRNDFDLVKSSRDYNLLQAFMGDTLHELSEHKDSCRAAAACWVKLLAQPLNSKYPLARCIMSSTIQEILSNESAQKLPTSTYLKLRMKLKEEDSRVGVWVKDGVLSANAIVVLHWCVENLGYDEFYFMISNIDEIFWRAHRHDVEIFERLVVYCYLCERLWRLERLYRVDLLHVDSQVLHALNSMQDKTGLSNVAVLYSIVNVCRHVITSMTDVPTRLTLPARYKTSMEAYHEKCRSTGFENSSGYFTVTINNLIDHSGWPSKITSLQNQLYDREYAWSVRVFLREFISVNLELDLTKRLHQAEDGFRDERMSTDSIPFVSTARSSQMSEDYATFKAAAKRVSYDDIAGLPSLEQPPSAGLDNLMSDGSNQSRLFRYSGSVRGSMTVSEQLQLDPEQRNSRMSKCGNESSRGDGDVTDNPTSVPNESSSLPDIELVSEMNRMSF